METQDGECNRCGQCCHYVINGKRTDLPCQFLEYLTDGKTRCKVYKFRIGLLIGYGNICTFRKNIPMDFKGCLQNKERVMSQWTYINTSNMIQLWDEG